MAMVETEGDFKVKLLRGSAAANDVYTGPEGELTVDLTNHTLRMHDGVTAGGIRLAIVDDLGSAS